MFFLAFCFVFLSCSFLFLGSTDTIFKVTNTNISKTLQVNNWRIPTNKNAKFPVYYFNRNTDI